MPSDQHRSPNASNCPSDASIDASTRVTPSNERGLGDAPTEVTPSVSRPTNAMPQPSPADQDAHAPQTPANDQEPSPLAIGEQIAGYRIITVLGRGSFATLYLAEHEALGKLVALKVSRERGQPWLVHPELQRKQLRTASNEACRLAELEHDSIVTVYAEEVVPERGLRLISMQYVWGTTLKEIIARAAAIPASKRRGVNLLPALSDGGFPSLVLSPAMQQERERFARLSYHDAVFRIAIQLTSALAVAHARGILHLDIKPANILINQAGRPLLADFNLAINASLLEHAHGIGGTLLYMAPEHLDACNPNDPTPPQAINERSDCYSLALVIFELATCQYPFDKQAVAKSSLGEAAEAAAIDRRRGVPSLAQVDPACSRSLDLVLRRAMATDPAKRFESAADFSHALEAAQQYDTLCGRLPPARWLEAASRRWPRVTMTLLAMFPHFIGNVLIIIYPSVTDRSPNDLARYWVPFLSLNALVYAGTVCSVYYFAFPFIRRMLQIEQTAPNSADEADILRSDYSRTLYVLLITGLSAWAVMSLSTVGWLDLHMVLTWLMTVTVVMSYSYFGSELLLVHGFYPRLLVMNHSPRITARRELRAASSRVGWFKLLAGITPMVGALLLVLPVANAEQLSTVRMLTTTLLIFGIIGFVVATTVGGLIQRTIDALAGDIPSDTH